MLYLPTLYLPQRAPMYVQREKQGSMSIQHITTLLEFCLKNTCFPFQGEYYKQVSGTTMGCSISSIVANLFLEWFESKAISSAPNPSRLWFRYVDDTFIIQEAEHSQQFLQYINSIDPHSHFTTEVSSSNG